jgi:hypothetical protein
VEGYCGHGDERSGFIKYWEVLEWLHNWQILKKGSAPYVSIPLRRMNHILNCVLVCFKHPFSLR